MNYYEMLLARKLAKGELPPNAYLLKEASGSLVSFSDGADLPMPSFICNIDAVQDLHGFDAPWVGGSNINLFDIKAKLTDNARTYTMGGITYTRIDDSDGNALSVKGTGTATGYSYFDIPVTLPAGRYKTNVSGSDADKMVLNLRNSDRSYFKEGNEEFTFTEQTSMYIRYLVATGNIADNTITCMVYKYDGTNKDFVPYENICPISGHTGVNAWVRGKNLTNIEDKTLSQAGYLVQSMPLMIKAGTYTLSWNTTATSGRIRVTAYDAGGTKITDNAADISAKKNTFEVAGDAATISIYANAAADFNNIMLEVGETASTYTPYNPNSQTIQVSWQTEAGEVYGGYIDLVSGELKVTHELVTYEGSNDENWGLNENYNLFNISIPSIYRVEQTPSSNLFKGLEPQSASNLSTKENGSFALYSTFGGINIKTDVAADVADFKTYLNNNNMQVVYKLATPITYQLTPTQIKSLLGTNNAWCDTGDVTLEYFGKGDA